MGWDWMDTSGPGRRSEAPMRSQEIGDVLARCCQLLNVLERCERRTL